MEFIRYCRILAIVIALPFVRAEAQTVYYPVDASTMIKNTALDMAQLLQSAVPGSTFSAQAYTSLPTTGIILQYDSTINDNQECRATGNGSNRLHFRAVEDNGLIFGVYQYLRELGFAFYQPGSIWNVTPAITNPFRAISKNYSGRFKYQSWFISGGHRLWIMDKNTAYNWNGSYIGENGHEWSIYMRRNGMLGKYRFAGHRGDIVTGNYLTTLQNNPCYVASNFGSRAASASSVPDVFNSNAKFLWADAIEKKYTQTKNNIFNNPVMYKDLLRSFKYGNEAISIEVPDGPRWGFGADSMNCNTQPYPSASNQAAILSNYTSQLIQSRYPGKQTQMYAYFTHADIPTLSLNNSIDVQVPTAYQSETSIKNLFKRWYRYHPNVSEYHYLNIPAWTGETPGFTWAVFEQAAERIKHYDGQGIAIEASPAKFSSIPLLKSLNDNLLHNENINTGLRRFCDDMFGNASNQVFELIKLLGDEQEFLGFKKDNRYRLPFLFKKMQAAQQAAGNENNQVQQRLAELKAYLHYIVLYYDYSFDEKASVEQQKLKAGDICIYLAKCNKLRIVNSYYLINRLISTHRTDSVFVSKFNSQTGTTYLQGNLPLINNTEIEQNYQQDLSRYLGFIADYKFERNEPICQKINAGDWVPAQKIFVKLGYTLGAQYPGRKQYNFYAANAGKIKINYNAGFEMPAYGQLNFVVEDAQSGVTVLFDSSIKANHPSGTLEINIPVSGDYHLIVSTRYQTTVDMEINTGGNVFYKDSPFLGDVRENFSSKPSSFPGGFYVPSGLNRVYFSLSNSYNKNTGYLPVEEVGRYFIFKDNFGKIVTPKAFASDSLLYYLEIPPSQSGTFWQFFNTANRFSLCFANISNYYWFGQPKACNGADFDIDVIKIGDECMVRVKAKNYDGTNEWHVFDKSKLTKFSNTKELLLPVGTSPYAVITHLETGNCSTQKSLWEEAGFAAKLENCASGATLPIDNEDNTIVAYPNPTKGIIQFKLKNGAAVTAQVEIIDILGKKLYQSANTSYVDMSRFSSAAYFYRLQKDGQLYTGKIQKH